MKVLVIGFGKIYIMSYLYFYLDQLKKNECEIHLVYWDRDGKADVPIPDGVIPHKFDLPIATGIPRWRKILAFWRYRKTVKKIITSGGFDLAVVLTTPPGVLLLDVLRKYFYKKYIFDFRDITMEKYGLFKRVVNILVDSSAITFVSSDAFKDHLYGNRLYTSHNILLNSIGQREARRSNSRLAEPIKIRYWGLIRHENINKSIIDRIAGDSRFELHYHGRMDGEAFNLEKYCSQIAANNVFFHGLYKPEERYSFAQKTDILHNIFENDINTQPAMANKFYDGITLYLPQLCNTGSYMGSQVTDHKIGLECDPYSQSFADDVFNYYHSIQWNEFEQNCDNKLNEIIKEYDNGVNVMNDFFKGARVQLQTRAKTNP